MLAIKILLEKVSDGQGMIRPVELARVVGVSPPLVYKWTEPNGKTPKLRSFKVGGVKLIDLQDAIDFLRERTKTS